MTVAKQLDTSTPAYPFDFSMLSFVGESANVETAKVGVSPYVEQVEVGTGAKDKDAQVDDQD